MHAQSIGFDEWADIAEELTVYSCTDHGADRITWGTHPALGLIRIKQSMFGSTVLFMSEHRLCAAIKEPTTASGSREPGGTYVEF